ncbi:hypothetical protein XELAEV_18019213mg [Xenopus laevis]|uniref:Ig-like domain-containing protein n=1 Tax=Xenopus laevis TaxID=8355 RepID=A0A974DHB4_XENLA|nr:hypothetical protein XELAEV_18019213mg [Xenopus laevis]
MSRMRSFLDPTTVQNNGRCPCPQRQASCIPGGTVLLRCSLPWPTSHLENWMITWERRLVSRDPKKTMVLSQYGTVKETREYSDRATLLEDGSLELQKVRVGDAGVYTLWVTDLTDESNSSNMCCEVTLKVENKDGSDGEGCSCGSKPQ